MTDYHEHYRILGLRPGDTPADLRRVYKGKIHRWHPDRHEPNDGRKMLAEDVAKEINRAYRELDAYLKQHGTLPLHDDPRSHPDGSRSYGPSAPEWVPVFTDPPSVKQTRSTSSYGIFIFLLILIVLVYLWLDVPVGTSMDNPSRSLSTAANELATPPDSSQSRLRFALGSTLGEVYSIQGVPSFMEGNTWHYGSARVTFRNGRVIGWIDSVPARLRASSDAPHPDPQTRPLPGRIQRGSSKEEVRTIQGTPIYETDDVWEYGVSRVYFDRNGWVTGWQESPYNPLHVK